MGGALRALALAAALAFPLAAGADDPLQGHTSGDAVGATLAAEFSLRAGKLNEAVRWYLRASEAVGGDAALAERAVQVALVGTDDALLGQALDQWRALAPPSLAMRSAQATWLLRTGRDRRARRELEELLRDPDPRAWGHAIAALHGGTRDQEASARILGRLVESGAIPDDFRAWLGFGGLAQRFGDEALTARIVDEVVERFPDEPRVALLRAAQARERGEDALARQALERVEEQALVSPELRMAIAAEYEQLGDLAHAARVMAMGPQDERSYAMRASLLVRAEDTPALEVLYWELEQRADAPNPAWRLLLGQLAEYMERPADALEWYRSVPGGQQRAIARLRIPKVLFDLGHREEAFAELRALQSDAGVEEELRRDAYLMEAELRREAGDADGELDAYARGLAAWPDEGALLYARALMWERRDDIERAEADLRRLLVAEPENVHALNALGYTLADRTGRYEEALELIDRARLAEPDNAHIIDSYGWVLYRLGRLDEALVELRRAWSLLKDAEVAAHVAEVLWVLGEKEEAREFFQRAHELDPENRSLRRSLEMTGVEL
ncbi:MAG: hypothetical protein GX761_00815 [Gammaproteobacteria bacterium]|nr:hypothetical protein [Gammaproteobacteria bacterium]